MVFLIEGAAKLGGRHLVATIVFDLGFAIIVAFLAVVQAEDTFELVAEGHLESCDEWNFGTIVDTRSLQVRGFS